MLHSKNRTVAFLHDGYEFSFVVTGRELTINVRKLLKLRITMNNGVVHLWYSSESTPKYNYIMAQFGNFFVPLFEK